MERGRVMSTKFLPLIILMLAILYSGCDDLCSRGDYPMPPLGDPDDWCDYHGRDGYRSVTYTYFCHQDRYKSFTYISEDSCDEWELESEFYSDCINLSEALNE